MNKLMAYATALSLAIVSNFSNAQVAPSECAIIQSYISTGNCTGSCIANYQQNHPECFASTSSLSSATQEIRSTSLVQMLAISQAITARNKAGNTRPVTSMDTDPRFGMAAGNSSPQWNAWGNVSTDKNTYDRGGYLDSIGTLRNNISDSSITNAVLGGDYQLSPSVAVGVSAAFDNSRGSAQSFNNGVGNGLVSNSTSGYSIAPYLGWMINQDWSLDATLGTGRVKLSSTSMNGKADRMFYGANLNYARWMDNWQLTGKGSFLHGEEKYDNLTSATSGALMAGTATTNKLDQLRIGAQAGYWMNENAMPYFGLAYSTDLSRSTSAGALLGSEIGRTTWICSVGANFFSIKNNMTGGISYNQEIGRNYAKNNNLMANINYRF